MSDKKTTIFLLYLMLHGTVCANGLKPAPDGLGDKVDKSLNAASAFSQFVQVLTKASKAAEAIEIFVPAFAFVSAAINAILIFIPQENEVVTEMKTQFADVKKKLDSIKYDLSSLEKDVAWAAFSSMYSKDESTIENTWDKLCDYVTSAFDGKADQKKAKADAFMSFYKHSATENSIASFYRYLTVNEISLKQNLLNLVIDKFNGDLLVLKQFSSHFTQLMMKGFLTDLTYQTLKTPNNKPDIQSAKEKLNNIILAIEKAIIKCISRFEESVHNIVEQICGKEKWSKPIELAKKIKEQLQNKFHWHDWVVIVYEGKPKGTFVAGRHIEHNVRDKTEIIIFYRMKGDQVDASIIKQLNDLYVSKRPTASNGKVSLSPLAVFNFIMAKAPEKGKHFAGFYGVKHVKDYAITDDKGHVDLYNVPQDGPSSFFLKGKQEVEKPLCSDKACQNKMCHPVLETMGEYCVCSQMLFDPLCTKRLFDPYGFFEITEND